MALYKEVTQEDGVITNYHRIIYMTQTVNEQNSIAVVSYINRESREIDNKEVSQYKRAATYETEYDESMDITKAYQYIKTLPEFADSEDV